MNVLVKLVVFHSDGEELIELVLVLEPVLLSAFISLVETTLIRG
jgi:hypothetical protein